MPYYEIIGEIKKIVPKVLLIRWFGVEAVRKLKEQYDTGEYIKTDIATYRYKPNGSFNKPIRRLTHNKIKNRYIIIQIEPSGIIKTRLKGTRLWYEVTVEDIWSLGAKKYAQKTREEKEKKNVR